MQSAFQRRFLVVILTGSTSRLPAGIYALRRACQFLPHQVARCPKIEGSPVVSAPTPHVGGPGHPVRLIEGGPGEPLHAF